MSVLEFRPSRSKERPSSQPPARYTLPVGAYAGRARFRPSPRLVLTPELRLAVGQVVELGFAGRAKGGEPFAGQALYLEWRRDEILAGFLIPEQDLEFLES